MGNTLQKSTKTPQKNPNDEEEEQQQHQDLEQEDGNGSTLTCEICIEPILLPNKKFKNGRNCTHPFCVECIIKYIAVRIEDNASIISCPALNCPNSLDPLFCRRLIPRQLFDKWCDVLCESAVLGLDRCYCPNRDCSALVLNECGGAGGVKRSVCPNCKKLFCFQCQLPWHAGYRCHESREMRDSNDVAFGVLIERRNWMRCPTCHHVIDRIEGCRIVKCRCGTTFCYKCGKELNQHWCECRGAPMHCICLLALCLFLIFIFPFVLAYVDSIFKR